MLGCLLNLMPSVGKPVVSAMKFSIKFTVTPCKETLSSVQFLKKVVVTCSFNPWRHSKKLVTFPFYKIFKTSFPAFQSLKFLGSCLRGSPPIFRELQRMAKTKSSWKRKENKLNKLYQNFSTSHKTYFRDDTCKSHILITYMYFLREQTLIAIGPLLKINKLLILANLSHLCMSSIIINKSF